MAREMHLAAVEPAQRNTDWIETQENEEQPGRPRWLAASLAIVAIVLWTALFSWAHWPQMSAGVTPTLLTGWIVDWSVPVLLVLAVWLVAMRYSRTAQARFNAAAQALGRESLLLDERLARLTQEFGQVRAAISADAEQLEATGKSAADRLSEHGERIQHLARANLQEIEAVSAANIAASENLRRLQEGLPATISSVKDLAGQIAQVGAVAQDNVAQMSGQAAQLAEAEQASEQRVVALRHSVASAIEELGSHASRLDELAEHRFENLAARCAALRAELDAQEDEALNGLHRRADALATQLAGTREEFDTTEKAAVKALANWLTTLRERATQVLDQLRASEAAAAEARENALAAFDQRMQQVDALMAERQQAQLAAVAEVGTREEHLAHRLGELSGTIEQLLLRGREAHEHLDQAAGQYVARLGESRELLAHNSEAVGRLTDESTRLLEIIEASAATGREALPGAIAEAQDRLAAFEAEARAVQGLVVDSSGHGAALASALQAARNDGATTLAQLATLEERLDAITRRAAELANHARAEMGDAIAAIEQASGEVVGRLREDQANELRSLAQQVATQGSDVLREALRSQLGEALSELHLAADQANSVGMEASEQLRRRLAEVETLAANLESRIAQAREQAEERVDEDFARRMTQITESLNAAAIDLSRVLASEISDTAWQGYLRGDRGIFTRQAVRLLDRREARSIAQLHAEDEGFRHAVNRYIADFEAMLRDLLATREGHRLGVTLLSSDAGKLYVALAQAIERLRG